MVFTGKVIEITRNPPQYRLRVERSWKDLLPDTRPKEILLTAYSADCEVPFEVGRTYLVYAYETVNNLTTNQCLENKEIEKAAEDLKVLGKGKKPGKSKS